jgi:hypothetical protein
MQKRETFRFRQTGINPASNEEFDDRTAYSLKPHSGLQGVTAMLVCQVYVNAMAD